MDDNQLQLLENLEKRIVELANRWVKAWRDSGYTGAWNIHINWPNRTVDFTASQSIMGYPFHGNLSLDYVKDDTNLERDAGIWWREYVKKRDAQAEQKRQHEQELLNEPSVQAYKKLKEPPVFPYCGDGIPFPLLNYGPQFFIQGT